MCSISLLHCNFILYSRTDLYLYTVLTEPWYAAEVELNIITLQYSEPASKSGSSEVGACYRGGKKIETGSELSLPQATNTRRS